VVRYAWVMRYPGGGGLDAAERAGRQLPAMSLARAQRLYGRSAVPANGLKELLSRYARQCGRPRVSR